MEKFGIAQTHADVIREMSVQGKTLEGIAKACGVTRERVRQVLNQSDCGAIRKKSRKEIAAQTQEKKAWAHMGVVWNSERGKLLREACDHLAKAGSKIRVEWGGSMGLYCYCDNILVSTTSATVATQMSPGQRYYHLVLPCPDVIYVCQFPGSHEGVTCKRIYLPSPNRPKRIFVREKPYASEQQKNGGLKHSRQPEPYLKWES